MDHRRWEHELTDWHSPDELGGKLARLENEYGSRLLTAPGTQFYRDAHPANVFAHLRGAERVRLVEAARPDFEIQVDGLVRAYEVTEADTPGRRRTAEIKAARLAKDVPMVRRVPEEEWLSPVVAAEALRDAAQRKNRDHYTPDWGLLILLNPVEYGAHQQAIEAVMGEATAAVRHRFGEVWVLWKGTAYNAWQGGVRGNSILRPRDPFEYTEDYTPEPLSSILGGSNQKDGD